MSEAQRLKDITAAALAAQTETEKKAEADRLTKLQNQATLLIQKAIAVAEAEAAKGKKQVSFGPLPESIRQVERLSTLGDMVIFGLRDQGFTVDIRTNVIPTEDGSTTNTYVYLSWA